MSGGFDSDDVHFFEFLDVAEDAAELGAELLFFFGSQREAGEVSDVFDVEVHLTPR